MAPTGYTAYGQTAADLLVSTATVSSTEVIVPSTATSIDIYQSDLTTQITDLKDSTEATVTAAPVSGGLIQTFYAPDDYDDDGIWVESSEGWVRLRPVGLVSSGGGSGTVTSVDNISPDGSGNVDLGLADVATSGDYSDLSSTPSLATVATSGDAGDLSNMRSAITGELYGAMILIEYDNGWNIDSAVASDPTVAKHFLGGSESSPPPQVAGSRLWDRPVA